LGRFLTLVAFTLALMRILIKSTLKLPIAIVQLSTAMNYKLLLSIVLINYFYPLQSFTIIFHYYYLLQLRITIVLRPIIHCNYLTSIAILDCKFLESLENGKCLEHYPYEKEYIDIYIQQNIICWIDKNLLINKHYIQWYHLYSYFTNTH